MAQQTVLTLFWPTPLAAGLVVLGAVGLAVATAYPAVLLREWLHPVFGLRGSGDGRDDEQGLSKVCSDLKSSILCRVESGSWWWSVRKVPLRKSEE